ncbi:MAG: hypothetical protein KGI06_02430 [Candidatus Micrarchaeota archaeon]|nr:hypothetical protein [Candidatus Micrarchaeota archaeon]
MSACRYKQAFIIAFAVLSLFLLNSYAQGAGTGTGASIATVQCIITNKSTTIGACIASALPLSLLGIGVSLMIVAITFMISHVLNHAGLRSFYRSELWEVAKSGIIVAGIFSALILASAAATALAGSTPQFSGGSPTAAGTTITNNLASLYTTVETKYLVPQLNASEAAFGAMLGLSVGTDLLNSITFATWLPIPIPTAAGFVGSVQFGSVAQIYQSNYLSSIYGSPALSVVNAGIDIETTVLIVMQMQHDLLYTIAAIGLGLLIPIGIIMRAIPFVRGIGGTTIALGIGLSIIYPTLLVALNLPVTNYIYVLTSAPAAQAACPFSFSLICTLYNSVQYLVNTVQNAGATVAGGIIGAPMYLAFGARASLSLPLIFSGFWTGFNSPLNSGIFPALNFVIDNTLIQSVQFILFVMDIIIAVPLTAGIARLLGGSLRLGVGRFSLT